MDERILETVKRYKRLAHDVMIFKSNTGFDAELPKDIQTAMLRLYYAKSLEARLRKCAALLSEDTDEQTLSILTEATGSVDEASASALEEIEEYARQERDFARMIDALSMGSEDHDLKTLLCKLYKCENIITMAYRFASAHSYTLTPEDYMLSRMDIDIEELLSTRETLVKHIAAKLDSSAHIC